MNKTITFIAQKWKIQEPEFWKPGGATKPGSDF